MSVEWVETTGRTLEEAKDAALDQLGVDERDAEFTVVEEARSGLFGRIRQEARVRARVRPDRPRPKVDRRDRRRRGGGDASGASPAASRSPDPSEERRAPSRPVPSRPSPAAQADQDDDRTQEEQAEEARAFLEGLLEAFDADGRAEVEVIDDDTIEARLVGDNLGLLIGPKGQTLSAVQDLARAAVQRGPRRGSRLRVDVGGYQQRRRAALQRFAAQVAEQVRSTGAPAALEAMSSLDRKVVHDAVNEVDGVHTRSEGDDPHRHVVVLPGDPD